MMAYDDEWGETTPWWRTPLRILVWISISFGLFCLTVWYQSTDSYKASKIEEAKEDLIAKTPVPFSKSVDGCTVYRFYANSHDSSHPLYYTRCASSTTTNFTQSQSCGKNRTCQVPQSITTENK